MFLIIWESFGLFWTAESMLNTAARDSRDESGKMLPAKHCICNIRHKATLRKTHRCQQQLLIHKWKSMLTSLNNETPTPIQYWRMVVIAYNTSNTKEIWNPTLNIWCFQGSPSFALQPCCSIIVITSYMSPLRIRLHVFSNTCSRRLHVDETSTYTKTFSGNLTLRPRDTLSNQLQHITEGRACLILFKNPITWSTLYGRKSIIHSGNVQQKKPRLSCDSGGIIT